MRHLFSKLRIFLFALLATVALSSCGFSKLDEQVKFISVESVEMKGLTGLQLEINIANSSRHTVELKEGVVEILSEGRQVAKLTQIGSAVSHKRNTEAVESLWRISGLNPIAMISTLSRLTSGEDKTLRLNYSALLSASGLSTRISEQDVDITNFINTFVK